ncbi:hypothetical protein VNO77_43272 [Canavalia gladiata]|uniref:Uncharacterized protein n=1 Tax=Canavalia gladiata TaxID=3824 RepID=A0AAN9JUI2_CANGL
MKTQQIRPLPASARGYIHHGGCGEDDFTKWAVVLGSPIIRPNIIILELLLRQHRAMLFLSAKSSYIIYTVLIRPFIPLIFLFPNLFHFFAESGTDAFSQSGLYSNHQDIAPQYSRILLGLSNTAGVLAGALGTAATGYILQHGSWNDVSKVSVGLYLVGTVVWNLFSTGEKCYSSSFLSFQFPICLFCLHPLVKIFATSPLPLSPKWVMATRKGDLTRQVLFSFIPEAR